MNRYTCHSGGCPGADMKWEIEGYKYGVDTISYSFPGHIQKSRTPRILSVEELNEGYDAVIKADESLRRNIKNARSEYMIKLLCRNWFQVKNSEAIFAVGFLKGCCEVDGGTGWAVQMAIDCNKPIYLFDQSTKIWYKYFYSNELFNEFITISTGIPKLTRNFAGIGTRKLDDSGRNAIEEIYKETFKRDIGVSGNTQVSQT